MLNGCDRTAKGEQREWWTTTYVEVLFIEVAKRRETSNYSELRPDAPQALAAPLGEINGHEHREGKPLLSAVAAHKDADRMSGDGFFRIAWELGRYKEGAPEQFWWRELEQVWNYWQVH